MVSDESDLDVMLGDPRRAIRRMALPLIVSFAVVQINSFVDTSWCSGLGADATAGMTTISPIYWIIAGLGGGIGVGASTLISRHLANGRDKEASSVAIHALALSLVISLLLIPILLFSIRPMMSLMGADDVSDYGFDYMAPIAAMSVFIMTEEVLAGLVRSEGAASKSMAMVLSAAFLNMILDPILIYGLGMGVAGAGLATALSSVLSCSIGIAWYVRGRMAVHIRFRGFQADRSISKGILGVGIPRATESIVVNGMSMVERYFVIVCAGSFGSALFSIPWRFVMIACVVSMAIAAAIVPVCSAAFGQNDPAKAREAYLYGTKLCTTIILAMTVFMFVFAEWCVVPFTMSETMLPHRGEFADVLRLYCVFIPFMGLLDTGSALLQSMRMASVSMWSSLLRNIIIVILFAALCHTDLYLMFAGMAAAEVFGGLLNAWLAGHGFYTKTRMRMWPGRRSGASV